MEIKSLNQFILSIDDTALVCKVHKVGSLSRAISQSTTTTVPDAQIPGVFRVNGMPVDVVLVDNKFYYLVHMTTIQVHSRFWEAGGCLAMHPVNRDSPPLATIKLPWEPPIPHYLLVEPRVEFEAGRMLWSNIYLFAYHQDQIWRPPLPNCYEDGRLCFGHNQPERGKTPMVIDLLEWVIQTMEDSEWNMDLAQDVTNKWVRFKPNASGEGFSQVPFRVPADLSGDLDAIGNTKLNKIADLCLK